MRVLTIALVLVGLTVGFFPGIRCSTVSGVGFCRDLCGTGRY